MDIGDGTHDLRGLRRIKSTRRVKDDVEVS